MSVAFYDWRDAKLEKLTIAMLMREDCVQLNWRMREILLLV